MVPYIDLDAIKAPLPIPPQIPIPPRYQWRTLSPEMKKKVIKFIENRVNILTSEHCVNELEIGEDDPDLDLLISNFSESYVIDVIYNCECTPMNQYGKKARDNERFFYIPELVFHILRDHLKY